MATTCKIGSCHCGKCRIRQTLVSVRRFSEGGNVLRGVEIFNAGEHRGQPYTEGDLDQIISNFNRYSTSDCKPGKGNPCLKVPLVIGHEEDQRWLDKTDLPAMGWVSRLYREGPVLLADIDGIAPQHADLIRNRRYSSVSAEIYPEPPEGIPGEGKMLRRVAALGADQPQLKDLAYLPMPEAHSEKSRFAPPVRVLLKFREEVVCSATGCRVVFSEVQRMATPNAQEFAQDAGQKAMWAKVDDAYTSKHSKGGHVQNPRKKSGRYIKKVMTKKWAEGNMDHDELMQQLQDIGVDTSLEGDALLADILRVLSQDDDAPEETPAPDQVQKNDDTPPAFEQPNEKHNAEPGAKYDDTDSAGGMDAASMSPGGSYDDAADQEPPARPKAGCGPEEHADYWRKMGEYCGKMAERFGPRKMDDATIGKSTMNLVNDNPTASPPATRQYSEQEKRIKAMLDETERRTVQRLQAARKADCFAEIEVYVKAGKLTRAEADQHLQLAMLQDHTRVLTFSEDGKTVKATAYEQYMAGLKNLAQTRKVSFFSEKIKTGGNGAGQGGDEEKARVAEHWDSFSERFRRMGTTRENFIKGFETLRNREPEATAEDYLKPNNRRESA